MRSSLDYELIQKKTFTSALQSNVTKSFLDTKINTNKNHQSSKNKNQLLNDLANLSPKKTNS